MAVPEEDPFAGENLEVPDDLSGLESQELAGATSLFRKIDNKLEYLADMAVFHGLVNSYHRYRTGKRLTQVIFRAQSSPIYGEGTTYFLTVNSEESNDKFIRAQDYVTRPKEQKIWAQPDPKPVPKCWRDLTAPTDPRQMPIISAEGEVVEIFTGPSYQDPFRQAVVMGRPEASPIMNLAHANDLWDNLRVLNHETFQYNVIYCRYK